jgi:CRISPR-associated protein Cas5d
MNGSHPHYPHPPIVAEVSGPYACFTRPELKTERFSYEIMTPSAARGVLEAIFWKPEFSYVIIKIEMLNQIQWVSIRRNEVTRTVSLAWVRNAVADPSVRYDAEADRDQRSAVCLRDVAYRIHAQMLLRPHADANVAKYRDQLRRRIARGACFSQPFLGTREFSASFGPPTDRSPFPESKDLGVMLHSIAYDGGKESYHWFHAILDQGVVHIPPASAGLPTAEPDNAGRGHDADHATS